MTRPHGRASLLAALAVSVLALGATLGTHAVVGHASVPHHASASTDTDDYVTPSSTHIVGTATGTPTTAHCGGHTPPPGTVTCFAVPGANPIIVVFCTAAGAGSTTLAPSAHLKAIPINNPAPYFRDGTSGPCTDSLGGTDTTAVTGTWTLQFKDAANDEAATEPNTGDHLTITVPIGGATVTSSLGCVIKVAPSAPFKVTGAYDDKNKLSVAITTLPVTTSGGSCPLPASTTSTFYSTYIFSPNVTDAS